MLLFVVKAKKGKYIEADAPETSGDVETIVELARKHGCLKGSRVSVSFYSHEPDKRLWTVTELQALVQSQRTEDH